MNRSFPRWQRFYDRFCPTATSFQAVAHQVGVERQSVSRRKLWLETDAHMDGAVSCTDFAHVIGMDVVHRLLHFHCRHPISGAQRRPTCARCGMRCAKAIEHPPDTTAMPHRARPGTENSRIYAGTPPAFVAEHHRYYWRPGWQFRQPERYAVNLEHRRGVGSGTMPTACTHEQRLPASSTYDAPSTHTRRPCSSIK